MPPSRDVLAGEDVRCWGDQHVHWPWHPEEGQPHGQGAALSAYHFLTAVLVPLPVPASVSPTVTSMPQRAVLLGWVAPKSVF